MRIGYAQRLIDRNDILAAFDAHALTSADFIPLIIIDKRLQISSVIGIQHNARVDIDLSAIRKYFLRRRCPGHIRDACLRDQDTFAAMIIQIKMRVIDRDQVHITVQTAKDRKVTRQRHQRIDPVIHAQRDLIHAVIHIGADVKTEGRPSAFMGADIFPVHIHIGDLAGALDFQI